VFGFFFKLSVYVLPKKKKKEERMSRQECSKRCLIVSNYPLNWSKNKLRLELTEKLGLSRLQFSQAEHDDNNNGPRVTLTFPSVAQVNTAPIFCCCCVSFFFFFTTSLFNRRDSDLYMLAIGKYVYNFVLPFAQRKSLKVEYKKENAGNTNASDAGDKTPVNTSGLNKTKISTVSSFKPTKLFLTALKNKQLRFF
ncbi:hypothetical protein RFI_18851, partial [Reticulomyxa filosa]